MKTTGRKFRCIGLEKILLPIWNRHFEMDKVYEEVDHPTLPKYGDMDGNKVNNDSIRLISHSSSLYFPYWVDASQFELIE